MPLLSGFAETPSSAVFVTMISAFVSSENADSDFECCTFESSALILYKGEITGFPASSCLDFCYVKKPRPRLSDNQLM